MITKMTNQEIFDKVATHLFTQGVRSVSKTCLNDASFDADYCLYRGPNGTKCAVGCLIPDEDYDPTMENRSAYDLFTSTVTPMEFPKLEPLNENKDILNRLQTVHDNLSNWATTETMKSALATVAIRYDLDGKVLKKLKFKKIRKLV